MPVSSPTPDFLLEPPEEMLPPPEKRLRERMLHLAKAYCRCTGYKEGTLSLFLFANGSRLRQLRRNPNLDVRTYTAERAIAWLEFNWPPGVAWPEGGQARSHRREA